MGKFELIDWLRNKKSSKDLDDSWAKKYN
jgi:hypothetical protein